MKTCLNCKTENPDDAHYCSVCRFTLDWSTTEMEDPTRVMEAVTLPSLELALGPGQARVIAGETANFDVRLANRGHDFASVTLQVAGPAQAFARPEPATLSVAPNATATATLAVAVPPGTTPQTMAVELYATQAGAPTGASVTAQAALLIEPPPPPPVRTEGESRVRSVVRRRRSALVPALLAVLAVVLLVVVVGVLTRDDGPAYVTGTVRANGGACLHSEPNLSPESRIPPHGNPCLGPDDGGEVHIDCAESDQILHVIGPNEFSAKWIARGLVELPEEVRDC